jgi:two-component system sensor histidine kinase KdpD
VARIPAFQVPDGRLWKSAKLAFFGSIAVAIVTFVSSRIHANFSIVSFLFLLIVLLQSFAGDFNSTVLVSLEAVAALDFFFVEPLYSFTVSRGIDIVSLAAFLITALVVTRLVARVRAEAESARRQQDRLARLYRLAQQLVAVDSQQASGMKFLDAFLGAFGITAVCVFDADSAGTFTAGESDTELSQRTRDAYISGAASDDRDSHISVRSLQVTGTTIGCIGFRNLDDPGLTAGALAALATAVLGRTRALERASESAAAAQAEVYRSAILDALAHEFQTPLATILAAAGGLREAGPLGPAQLELTETVETEAARLGSLTSRLLRVAKVDREEVKPKLEPVEMVSLLEELVAQYARRWSDLRVFLLTQSRPVEASADPELLRLAVSQLLENACKYSRPGSTVSLQVQSQGPLVDIRVSNRSNSIPARERQKIFDRFYRGSNAAASPGSGLGLYVARKIALAHGGTLELETDGRPENEVSFRLSIPVTRVNNHVAAS